MFATVLTATVVDHGGLRPAWDTALATIASSGTGWLGSISGLMGDGEFIAILAFESREAGRMTMDELGEGPTWRNLTPYLEPMSFHECPHVRGAGLHEVGRASAVDLRCGMAHDIGRVIEVFERAIRVEEGPSQVSGLLCWDEAGFSALAIQRSLPDGDTMPATGLLGGEVDMLMEQRLSPTVTRPWSVLSLGRPA